MPEETAPQLEQHDEEAWRKLAEDSSNWPEDHEGLQVLRENHVNRLLGEKGLGHLVTGSPTPQYQPSKEDKAGGRFLHKHGSLDEQQVNQVVGFLRENGATIPDKAGDRTAHYLDFMSDKNYVGDGILTGDQISIENQVDAHVISPDNVPESYFELQRRIAREQGHGDIEITPDARQRLIEAARADQRGSLNKWVEYLGGDDGNYPDWFKRFTWDSVTRLGNYDKETSKFARRDEHTVAAYPEINREALAYVYDTINKFHVIGDQQVDNAKLKSLIKEGSFGRLYAHAILEVTPDNPELKNSIEGSWTQYHQTDDPRTARRLSGSLQGHGTGWCTAGESTAEQQLSSGDFYVFYTKDEDGKDTIPRLAIRMEDGLVSHDVRGVLPEQEVEPILYDVLQEKLETLPGGETYMQKAEDMKRLTVLDNLLTDNPDAELSKDDILFIYGADHPIRGFGYDDDPRVARWQRALYSEQVLNILQEANAVYAINMMQDSIKLDAIYDDIMRDWLMELGKEELMFVYQLDHSVQGIDLDDDNRLYEVHAFVKKRNFITDMAVALETDTDINHIVEKILDQGNGAYVLTDNLNKLDRDQRSTAVSILIERKLYEYLPQNFVETTTLDESVAFDLLNNDNETLTLRWLSHGVFPNQARIIDYMVERGDTDILIDTMSVSPAISGTQRLADELIENDNLSALARLIGQFRDLDVITFNSLVISGHGNEALRRIDNFEDLGESAMQTILKYNRESLGTLPLSKFSHLSDKVAQEFINEGYIDRVIKNRSVFDLEPDTVKRLGLRS